MDSVRDYVQGMPPPTTASELDYHGLLVYGVATGAEGSESLDDPWIATMDARAAADGFSLSHEVGYDGVTTFLRVWLTRADGTPFDRQAPRSLSWRYLVEAEWGEQLDAARCRAQVERYLPPPPERLQPALQQLYRDGFLPPPSDSDIDAMYELLEATGLTGIRALFHTVLDETRTLGEPMASPFMLTLTGPHGIYRLPYNSLNPAATVKRYRTQLEADWGERLERVRTWARGEQHA